MPHWHDDLGEPGSNPDYPGKPYDANDHAYHLWPEDDDEYVIHPEQSSRWPQPWPHPTAEEEADILRDEEEGYNWGPPPNPNLIHDPGFSEDEVDDHPDPDIGHENKNGPHPFDTPIYHPGGGYEDLHRAHGDWEHQLGQEDHKMGAVLRQADQWPERVASYHSEDFGPTEHLAWGSSPPPQKKTPPPPVNSDVQVMRGKDTGLYGTDENDTYDVYAKPSPEHGPKAYDVIRPVKQPKSD